jgi:hypothetical protein
MNAITAALLEGCPKSPAGQRQQPMLPIRGVVSLLDRDEDAVLRLIEDGDLLWAFDVALQPKRARKKALRVLPQAVDDYRAGRKCALQWPDVQRLLLAGGEQTMPSPSCVRLMNVCQAHVAALLRHRELLVCKDGRRGRGGAALVWTYSFTDFLKRRCFPVPLVDI